MATNAPFGLRPARHLAGGQVRTKRYTVTNSGAVALIAIGSPVRHNPNGDGIAIVSSDVAKDVPILGAVTALYDANGRPMTFSQPTRGPYLPPSGSNTSGVYGYADVADDPNTVFIAQIDATVLAGDFGKFCTGTCATTGVNTAAGTSVMLLKRSTIDTSVAQYQVLGIAHNESTGFGTTILEGNLGGPDANNAKVDVLIANHIYRGNVGTAVS
jgi:hypothetical protein